MQSTAAHAVRVRPGRGLTWGRQRPTALLVAALAVLPLMPGALQAAGRGTQTSPVIVIRAAGAAGARAEAAVRAVGGTVERQLGIIHGFTARVPASSVPTLQQAPGVSAVAPDRAVHAESAVYSSATDGGSMYNVTKDMGAQAYWGAGYTGAGVGVALIDSGVVPVDGLTSAGKVVNGPDLSWESQVPALAHLDTYGHGTHMAGIIAGRASGATPGAYTNDSTNFIGVAPDAHLVSVKVADQHGVTDVSQVIAAIDWVVHHRNDNGLNVRVINLSYGTDSSQSYQLDPLAFAAEQAWNAGIFVVAAAGNNGSTGSGSLLDPAYDPNLMAVGAADETANPNTVAAFSSIGNASRSVDLVAPGTHVVSLRDPGSYIDQTYGSTGGVTPSLFRGSGTSQATAVTSGAAALVIQQHPGITPDQLKALLNGTASALPGMSAQQEGHGELNLANALNAPVAASAGHAGSSSGTGSLESARGSLHTALNGVALAGEQDIFGHPFDSAAMAAQEAAGSTWSDGNWNGSTWSGSTWSGATWPGSTWSGSTWSGATWPGSTWSGSTWSGATWPGSTWSGSTWSGATWPGSTWSGSTWSGATWPGSTWSGSTWSGSTWSGSTWSGSTWSGSTWSGSTWSGSTWSGSTWSGSTWSGSTWSGSTWSDGAWAGSTWS